MIKIKPEGKPAFQKAVDDINKYVSGDLINKDMFDIDLLQRPEIIIEHLEFLLNSSIQNIARAVIGG